MIISASLRQAAACRRHKATVESLMIYIAAIDDVTAVIPGFLHHATSDGQIIIPSVDDARHDLTGAPEIITFSAASD
jgi:hypothetical protein